MSEEATATTRRVLAFDESDVRKRLAEAMPGDGGCIARNQAVEFGQAGVRSRELGIIGA
jgi:hypothetical protein